MNITVNVDEVTLDTAVAKIVRYDSERVTWMLEGPAGAYTAAGVIAAVLRDEIEALTAREAGDGR